MLRDQFMMKVPTCDNSLQLIHDHKILLVRCGKQLSHVLFGFEVEDSSIIRL